MHVSNSLLALGFVVDFGSCIDGPLSTTGHAGPESQEGAKDIDIFPSVPSSSLNTDLR